jgi:hypothetical protein
MTLGVVLVHMWRTFASIDLPSYARHGLPKLLGLAATLALASVLVGFCACASGRDAVPGSIRVRGIMISCYHEELRRFTAEVNPARCDIAGHEGEQRKFVSFPIQNLRWSEWGEFRSEGSYGVDVRNGIRVRLIAFRRVRCTDGRIFYSAVNVVEPGNGSYSVVRLPTCDDPVSIR